MHFSFGFWYMIKWRKSLSIYRDAYNKGRKNSVNVLFNLLWLLYLASSKAHVLKLCPGAMDYWETAGVLVGVAQLKDIISMLWEEVRNPSPFLLLAFCLAWSSLSQREALFTVVLLPFHKGCQARFWNLQNCEPNSSFLFESWFSWYCVTVTVNGLM